MNTRTSCSTVPCHASVLNRLHLVRLMLVLTVALAGPASADPGAALEAAFAAKLDTILTAHKDLKVRLGARVIELPGGKVLYDRNGEHPLIPASNMKLLVMAAAINRLGPDYEFKTVLAVRGKDLVVIGGGDPTIGDEVLAAERRQSITALFHDWAAKLRAAGIQQIPGNLVIDDSIFDQRFVHPNWPADQFQRWYEAPVGGLNFNANCTAIQVTPTKAGRPAKANLVPGNTYLQLENRTTTGAKPTVAVTRKRDSDTLVVSGTVARQATLGPVTVRDPGIYFGSILKTVLAAEGIRVNGKVVREKLRHADGSIPKDCHIVAVHRTPLNDALARAGKDSLGMMAEAVLKLLGTTERGVGTWESGRAAVEEFVRKNGVSAGQVTVDDGSGLSKKNRLSAGAMTQVLRFVFCAPDNKFEVLRESLAKAGVDGTLEKRMRSPDTKGRIFAKTGYVQGVRTLAGFVHTRSGRWLAFAFYYNNAAKTRPLTRLQDEACAVLVNWPDVN